MGMGKKRQGAAGNYGGFFFEGFGALLVGLRACHMVNLLAKKQMLMVESASALRQSPMQHFVGVFWCGDLLQLTRFCESNHCENETSSRLRLKFKPVASPLHH